MITIEDIGLAVIFGALLANLVLSFLNRRDIDDIQSSVNFIHAHQKYGKSNVTDIAINEVHKKLYDINKKLDDIDTANKQIKIGEHFIYQDEQYVVEGISLSKSIGNTPKLDVKLVKGESVVIRG